MNKLLDIYTAPKRVFTSLKEKPEWVKPLIIVLIVVAITASLIMIMNKETIIAKQEEAMKERGMSEEEIETRMKIVASPISTIAGAIGAAIFTVIILLILAAILNLFIPVFFSAG